MTAAPRLRRKENTIKLQTAERLPDVLKVAAIYGPNASGKSALVRALDCIPELMRREPGASARPLAVWPFRFDAALLEEPSKFEYHFVQDGMRYQFDTWLRSDRVIWERLLCFPRGKEQLLYDRAFKDGAYAYQYGSGLLGSVEIHEAWAKLTGPRTMFLSQAVANSSEDLKQLRAPYDWFDRIRSMSSVSTKGWVASSEALAAESPRFAKEISTFLSDFDIPIKGMFFKEKQISGASHHGVSEDRKKESSEMTAYYTHTSSLGTADFSSAEESDGTQNLIGFWLPWSLATQGRTDFCSIFIVDEMDSSLHPKIVESLIRSHLAQNSSVQLIFTTHDTHLMNAKLLRRDQFWVMERDENAASQLRSVHDFAGRESEDIEKRYYEGRYRGLPIVKRGRDVSVS